jgi:hypothetical protein
MFPFTNAEPTRQHATTQVDGGELELTLLHGTGPAAGQRCILRITTDANGRLRSEIVYFYDPAVVTADLDADFDLLARGGMVSMGQLHHSEAMMNRGRRVPR